VTAQPAVAVDRNRVMKSAIDALQANCAAIVRRAPEVLAAAGFTPYPAARWHWFDALPIQSPWHRNRTRESLDDDIERMGEGARVTRSESAVVRHPLARA